MNCKERNVAALIANVDLERDIKCHIFIFRFTTGRGFVVKKRKVSLKRSSLEFSRMWL